MAFRGVIEDSPSFGTQLARGLGQGIGAGLGGSVEFAKRMALEKQKSHSLAEQTKHLEKVKMMETGLGTIDQMRQLISSAGPSNWLQGFLGVGDVREKRAQLEALGRSLIPLVSAGVPIRNQKEFEEYRKIITDPNSRQADLEGALNGIESILKRSMDVQEADEERAPKKSMKKAAAREKFDVNNPKHKARRDQVLSKTKGDRKKAEQVLLEEFEL